MRSVSIGIISIGDMGLGIARLLKSHGYHVLTIANGRSEDTLSRIRLASIEAVLSDQDLVVQSDYIFSIVPPRDALATANRIAQACKLPNTAIQRQGIPDLDGRPSRRQLYYVDLNAIPARLSSEMNTLFTSCFPIESENPQPACYFLDGGIIGGPPSQNQDDGTWKKPSLVVSGSIELPLSFVKLAETLNMKIVSPRIGAASTLKLSFAALTKGLTALSILSLSSAERDSLLPELLQHLQEYSPSIAALVSRGVTGMPPKAYRWVDEMRGIGEMIDDEGRWDGLGSHVYESFAEVYRSISEDTILGAERVSERKRGKTVEDVISIIASSRGNEKTGK